MEKKIPTVQRVATSVSELKVGDVIYLSSKSYAIPYQVLDIGSPFILIENMKSHFANLVRIVNPIYKELCQ